MFLTISINFHQPMSVQYIFSIAGVFAVAHIFLQNASCILHTHTFTRTCIANRRDQQVENITWSCGGSQTQRKYSVSLPCAKKTNPAKNSGFCGEMHVKGRRSGKQTVCWCQGAWPRKEKIAQRIYFCIRNTYKARKIAQTIYFRKKMHAKGGKK